MVTLGPETNLTGSELSLALRSPSTTLVVFKAGLVTSRQISQLEQSRIVDPLSLFGWDYPARGKES